MSFISQLKKHLALGLILLIYLALAATHSIVAPLTVGNDEWAHFLYVRFIAEHGHLPTTLAERAEAGYKADAPPLYHLLAAAATAGVEPTRLLRPLDSPRRQLADNWPNPYALVHSGYELPPYRGEVLLWHLGRGVSILFGLALIGLTYLTSLALWPSRRRALLAAAGVAFIPAVVFHSSVLTYESLSAAVSALFLLVSLQAIARPRQARWWFSLGLLAGLAITIKYSAILLPFEIGGVAGLAWFKWRQHQPALSGWRFLSKSLLLAGAGTLLAASWWFGFLLWHFNTIDTHGPLLGVLQPLLVGDGSDTTSVAIAASLFGQQGEIAARSPLPRDYWQLTQLLLDSFWAAPVAGRFILSPWLALAFSLAALVSLAGLWPIWRQPAADSRIWLSLLVLHTVLIVPLLAARVLFSYDPREAVQGRHLLLPAASAIAILWAWGWSHWSGRLGAALVVGLLLWSGLGQVGWAAAAYPAPMPVWVKQAPPTLPAGLHPLDENLAEGMRLTGVSWRETSSASLEVTLWWEASAFMPADYLIELSLQDQAGLLVSYTLGQPVQGRYPTRAWEPGDIIKDTHWLPLTGSLPDAYQLQLRLLDRSGKPLAGEKGVALGQVTLAQATYPAPDPCAVWFQGRPGSIFSQPYRLRSTLTFISPEPPRLTALSAGAMQPAPERLASLGKLHFFMVGPDWSSRYQVQAGSTRCRDLLIDLPPRHFTPPPIPQPLVANFNDEAQLLGYDLPTRRIQPGQRLPLTLYWQSLTYPGADYQIFDNLLDSQQRRWGGYDRRPRDGYSTLLWVPGEVITDAFGVPVDPAAPPGIYTLDLGLYEETDGGAVSLPLLQNGQPTGQNSIRLGPIKVGGPPPGLVIEQPQPQVKVEQTLGHQITLLGYDVADNCQLTIDNCQLSIKLYWQAETTPAADYTTFFHLRDAANENIAQKDSPPAEGRYPTGLWDVGEVIGDALSLPLIDVPPGRYTPVVGLYNPVTGERLAVPDNPANEIPLEPIELP
ncbi:MAG: glycosyltransferase family 39 protein [Anaerolineae bacterium]|nr:glycosyltransferase family 39 protein [Anaerolineae bacterium]